MKNQINYPIYISNKPCGEDLADGKSQERLSNAISEYIISTDRNESSNLPRIIGLEGGWGVGKSNVIQLLESKLKDKYYFFEYDAWGHQEDLQRRSFLEEFTTKLVEDNILVGKTTISVNGVDETVDWHKAKEYLLSRKSKVETSKIPKLNNSFVAMILTVILTTIAVSIANVEKIKENGWLSLLITFVPLFLAFVFLLLSKKRIKSFFKKKMWKELFSDMFVVYSGKIENELVLSAISEREPSVNDFRQWMCNISKYICDRNKRIVIVYDNMDRLPSEKVKQLWSSIHTFFAEGSFNNIWTLIPFDKNHLSCAFDNKEKQKELVNLFISKTFPIIYSVTPPVITDFEKIFDDYFVKAFGNTQDEYRYDINRIYRNTNNNATIRDIIGFINQLVTLKNIWRDEISLIYIAIFTLKRDEILDKPIEQLLSGKYLSKYICQIIADDEILKKNISALVYGVPCEIAVQIPMSKYLDDCFITDSKLDINKYIESKHFIPILDDKVHNNSDNILNDNIIHSLSKIDMSSLSSDSKDKIIKIWDVLAKKKMKTELPQQSFNDIFKILLLLSNNKTEIIKYLCVKIQHHQTFNGDNYYDALNDLSAFLKDNNIDINLTEYLDEIKKEPKTFIDYVFKSKGHYLQYKMSTNPTNLSSYLVNSITENPANLYVIQYLVKDSKYGFEPVVKQIEKTIREDLFANESDFKYILDAYKVLSNQKPLYAKLSSSQQQKIWNTFVTRRDTPEFLEIATLRIAQGSNIGDYISDDQIPYISEQIEFYDRYDTLMINNLSWDYPILSKILRNMTEERIGVNIDLTKILPRFSQIISSNDFSEVDFIEQLNSSGGNKESIDTKNITDIVCDPIFFKYSSMTKNELSDYLNRIIVELLSTIQYSGLYQQINNGNDYWTIVINSFIDTDFLKILPENLTNVGVSYINDIASGVQSIPTRDMLIYKIIDKIDKRKMPSHIQDIKDAYCNGKYSINSMTFSYFYPLFKKYGRLKDSANRVVHRIIEPILDNSDCINILINDQDYYAEIINAAGEDATQFREMFNKKLKENISDANLLSFAEKIGVK